jgi:hypothetical protein
MFFFKVCCGENGEEERTRDAGFLPIIEDEAEMLWKQPNKEKCLQEDTDDAEGSNGVVQCKSPPPTTTETTKSSSSPPPSYPDDDEEACINKNATAFTSTPTSTTTTITTAVSGGVPPRRSYLSPPPEKNAEASSSWIPLQEETATSTTTIITTANETTPLVKRGRNTTMPHNYLLPALLVSSKTMVFFLGIAMIVFLVVVLWYLWSMAFI